MKKTLLAAAMTAPLAMAHAAAPDASSLSIGGFGTLGAAVSDTGDVQFARYNQAVGVKDSPRIGLDSNLGLQVTYQANDWLSATAQVLTRKSTSPEFTTELTWAFLRMKVGDETSVRVGRIVVPAFAISDYQNVGYANTMMRPPVELYGQDPIEGTDGVDVNFQHSLGGVDFTAQAYAGVSRGKLFLQAGGGQVAKFTAPGYGLALSAEYKPFTVRFAHLRSRFDSRIAPVTALAGALRSAGFSQLGDDITLEKKRIHFTSVALGMDWNSIVLQGEYGRRRPQEATYAAATDAWYVFAGYRFGKIMPYYAHAAYSNAGSTVNIPAALAKAPPLAAAVGGLLAPSEQSSHLVGVRWDVAKSMALKVQVDRVHPLKKTGFLSFPKPGAAIGDVTVLGVALDFVF
ncbi:MAG: porin [Pseudomonadota bacterium]